MSNNIADYISDKKNESIENKPHFFSLSSASDEAEMSALINQGRVLRVVDDFREQQLELYAINNPTLVYTKEFHSKFEDYYKSLANNLSEYFKIGKWVYFPWNGSLVHVLDEQDFFSVRTARNMNLITKEEQLKFYNGTIGIAGLSVGSSVAYAIVLQGGGKKLKLADMDKLALTNTNRILSGVENLGSLKVEMAARRIYEINPYANIEVFSNGVNKENIDNFFNGLDIVIDEIDNLAVKYLIREKAKEKRIAVVMAADNGDNAVIDIDRYDLDQNTPYFHDRMGQVNYELLTKLDKFGIGKLITKLVGPENVTDRMKQSLLEMGKTIVSWPQLGGAAMINGAAVAYCVRRILNQQSLEKNRALLSLDEKLIPEYFTDEEIKNRQKSTNEFKKIFGL